MSQDSYRPSFNLSRVDASVAQPVRLFFASAFLWLVLASMIAVITAIQLKDVSFLGGCSLTTYGRLKGLESNLFTYGWLTNALFAINLWLMSSLTRFELKNAWLANVGGVVWNLTLTYGAYQILMGKMNGFSLLEMPKEVALASWLGFLLAALWPAVAFSRRPTGHVYVSQWYILGSTLVFPITFALTQLLVLWCPAQGVLQALVHSWYYQNLHLLWFASSAIAAVYYFIPKESGRTVAAYYLSTIGFWTFFLFASWTGPATLLGSPLPLWVQSVGVVAALLMLIPFAILAIHFLGTLSWNRGISQSWNNTTLRFVLVAIFALILWGLLFAASSTRGFNAVIRFTAFTVGLEHLLSYTFVTFVIFGAAYYILPKVTGMSWLSSKLVHLHFWSCAIGTVSLLIITLLGGWQQGSGLRADWPSVIFPSVLLLIGHIAFGINAFGMLTAKLSSGHESTHA
jgi:cytochrome c oxidase cbb3-type subunit 1